MARKKPSSRDNGRLSKGPTTQEGKDRSRYNAAGHGLASGKLVVLKWESEEMFNKYLMSYRNRFQPLDMAEEDLVYAIAANRWRYARLIHIQTRKINQIMFPDGEDSKIYSTDAYTNSANAPTLDQLQRYESRLEMNYQRNLRSLALLRKEFPIPEALVAADTASETTIAENPIAETSTAATPTEPRQSWSGTVEPQSLDDPKPKAA